MELGLYRQDSPAADRKRGRPCTNMVKGLPLTILYPYALLLALCPMQGRKKGAVTGRV